MGSQKENKINSIVDTALKNLNTLVDVNTVVGKPVKTEDNGYLIPITKVTLGVLAGGGEYGKVSLFKNGSELPYSAGNGAIISLKPCGFLIKEHNGDYKLISVGDKPCERIVDKALEMMEKLQGDQS